MKNSPTPIIRDLVLVGGGHSHVTVLKRFGMKPLPGVRLTLICRDVHTPYSGMLPGLVAGHYDFDQAHIDLAPLAGFAGARLYHDEVIGLDLERKQLACRNRPPVSYDILSINIGSTPTLPDGAGAAEGVVAVKPISSFVGRWERLRQKVKTSPRPLKIGVVGAGAGGVELTLAAQHALKRLLNNGQADRTPEFHLFSATEEILPTHNNKVRGKFRRILGERGVQVHTGCRVTEVHSGRVRCHEGPELILDEVLWVTQASAAPWLKESGIDVDSGGFIKVQDTLESTSHPGVFAAGDIAAVLNHPREKAGVFAVRQGRPLEQNLRRALLGKPLEAYAPQRSFLSLISTGDRYAVASRSSWSLEGPLIWKWKDWIDRRFMDKFNVLPEMSEDQDTDLREGLFNKPEVAREITASSMRCGGCGAKVGSTVLDRVLSRLQGSAGEEILIGLAEADDSVVASVPQDKMIVQSVDFFRAIVDDPYIFGKITANHCLADIFAMGAKPRFALAIAVVPYGIDKKIEDTLEQMLVGAIEVLETVNASLVGGHSSEGMELSLGFSVTGLVEPDRILRKRGMRPGDRLILTKAIGTGTLFAANMRLKAKGRWITAAVDSMLQPSQHAADCLRRNKATACTDVSGFGLLGHLLEMARASHANARLFLEAIPLLKGVRETVGGGILSSLQTQNSRLENAIGNRSSARTHPDYPVLFDPQTAGGLLASVPEESAKQCVEELRSLGCREAAIIGAVEPRSGPPTIQIETAALLEKG